VKERPRLYIVGADMGYYRPWAPLFAAADTPDEADVCLFTGGSDISPELYGEKNVASHPYPERDAYEVSYFEHFKEAGIPMIGICRGAQLICALNGGKLFQHVPGHTNGSHMMITDDGEEYETASLHRQMLRPEGDYRLIAWAPHRANEYIHESNGVRVSLTKNPQVYDPEVVFYNNIRALCIQGHPEFMDTNHETNVWFRKLAEELLL
jgi:GMP synthase-like glutamine amidotransferase